MSDTPRVWVGSLAAYNAGSLIGDWFDATEAPTDSREWVDAMAERGHMPTWQPEDVRVRMAQVHEEIWVFDHEGFHGILEGECSPSTARELAEALESADLAEGEWPAFGAYCSNLGERPNGDNLGELVEGFRDAFCGYFESERDYAYDLAEDMGVMTAPRQGPYGLYDGERDLSSEWPFSCVDWDRAWNELRIGGDNWSEYIDGHGYAIFRSY